MLNSISAFATKTKVNLYLVGDAAEKQYHDEVKDLLSLNKNIEPIFFGYLYPIPRKLIRLSDVVIASSGSVLVGYENGIPTIAVDGNDFEAIGVYGKTTKNTLFRENEPKGSISSLLEDILIEHKYTKTDEFDDYDSKSSESTLMNHFSIIEQSDKEKIFYEVHNIYNFYEKCILRAKNLIIKTIGESNLRKIKKYGYRLYFRCL